MNRTIILLFLALQSITMHAKANSVDTTFSVIALQLDSIKSTQATINQSITIYIDEMRRHDRQINVENVLLRSIVDSLKIECSRMANADAQLRNTINNRFALTDASIKEHKTILNNATSTIYFIIILIVIATLALSITLILKLHRNSSSIDEIRRVLQAIEEESIDLDSKILELLERQITERQEVTYDGKVDHSLALRIADSIVRIEQNLSRIDASIKGYKRLSKAIKRMRDNFQSSGYEIVDMLGKTYDESMEADATFVQDKKLKAGKQKISEVIRPQVKYNGTTIQRAEIVVGQKAKPQIFMHLNDSEA